MIRFVTAAICLYMGCVLQLALSQPASVFGIQPDFVLVAVASLGMCLNRTPAAAWGVAGGIMEGALVGANLTHYAISRAVAGFVAAWTRRMRFESTLPVVGLTVAFATIVGQILFMFTAAPRGIVGFLGDTIGSAMYNGVLAMPVYSLLRRVLNPPVR